MNVLVSKIPHIAIRVFFNVSTPALLLHLCVDLIVNIIIKISKINQLSSFDTQLEQHAYSSW
ncbi:hypothetical protein HanXRQr2_Chr14g0646231 [Helianthus annuus]|uniref:Uncharacterized protein n=1 Tax=Helianthus annuus TaxID=4232 RepID=A0A251SI68_HELAN|nr:hypothetical protein HanXRQr2_Chr14g0646231 [Helianthus annuus]